MTVLPKTTDEHWAITLGVNMPEHRVRGLAALIGSLADDLTDDFEVAVRPYDPDEWQSWERSA